MIPLKFFFSRNTQITTESDIFANVLLRAGLFFYHFDELTGVLGQLIRAYLRIFKGMCLIMALKKSEEQ